MAEENGQELLKEIEELLQETSIDESEDVASDEKQNGVIKIEEEKEMAGSQVDEDLSLR